MTAVYGGIVLIAVVAGILYIAGRPVLRPKRNVNGSDSAAYVEHTYRGRDHDDRSDSGSDSSDGGDGGGGGGGD
jgi:hypothetical protein